MAELIRPQTSILEVPGSNPSPAVVPSGKAPYPHCLVPRKQFTESRIFNFLTQAAAILGCRLEYI